VGIQYAMGKQAETIIWPVAPTDIQASLSHRSLLSYFSLQSLAFQILEANYDPGNLFSLCSSIKSIKNAIDYSVGRF
jgi:hypothetical protein